MTLPEDVAEADEALVVDGAPAIWQHYPAIRTHLLSQDAEIDRLRANNDKLYREHVALQNATVAAESRLAAANALLRDIRDWDVAQALGPTREKTLFALPIKLRSRLAKHLQGSGDEATD